MFTIQPGLLVGLKSRIIGGYSYKRVDTENRQVGDGELVRWETTKEVVDSAEFKRAAEVRTLATRTIRKTCRNTPFGLICPIREQGPFRESITEAEAIAATFNATAKYSTVTIHVLCGEVSDSDESAVRAIMSEMKVATDEMLAAIAGMNPEGIRQAAAKARDLGRLLDDDAANKVAAAVKAARKAARAIVKRVETAGEDAGVVLREQNLSAIESMRFSFLDMSEHTPTVESDDIFGGSLPVTLEVPSELLADAAGTPAMAAMAAVETRGIEMEAI